MKTITLTVSDDAKITVDGVPYPTKAEVKLWTPQDYENVNILGHSGEIHEQEWLTTNFQDRCLEAGNIRPTREYIEALDRKHRAESVIFRYFYERGIDTRWKEGETQWTVLSEKGDVVVISYVQMCYGSPFYVESQTIAEAAIADIPDAIRTALLGGWV